MAPTSTMLQSLLLAAAAVSSVATASANSPPSTGQEWVSLHANAEFQPAAPAKDANPKQQRALRQAQERFLQDQSSGQPQQQTSFVDSQETYYDAYAQAWRYVGFYTDCNPAQGDRRRLNEDEDSACARYLIWAAVSTCFFCRLEKCRCKCSFKTVTLAD